MTPIRDFTDADRRAIAALQLASWQVAYADHVPPEHLAQVIPDKLREKWRDVVMGPRDLVLIAGAGLEPDGFISVWDRPIPYIDNFHVRPGLQGRGIGAALFEAVARRLLATGRRQVELTVLVDNTGARRFYERLGAENLGEQDDALYGHPVRACLMRWPDLAARAAERAG